MEGGRVGWEVGDGCLGGGGMEASGGRDLPPALYQVEIGVTALVLIAF